MQISLQDTGFISFDVYPEVRLLDCIEAIFNFLRNLCTVFHNVKSLSRVLLSATPWTVAYQAPPSMGFSIQEYWSELPFPSPEDLPDPEIEPRSSTLQEEALPSEPLGKPLVFFIKPLPISSPPTETC